MTDQLNRICQKTSEIDPVIPRSAWRPIVWSLFLQLAKDDPELFGELEKLNTMDDEIICEDRLPPAHPGEPVTPNRTDT